MTLSRRIPIAIVVLFLITRELSAVGATFETGPRHVASAWNINKGGLYLAGQGRFYTKHETFIGPNRIESGRTIWDSQTSAGVYWGAMPHLQLGVTPIITQKNHQSPDGIDSPGDLLIHTKLGSIGPTNGRFALALQFDARLPLAKHHNIPLQPYSADAVGFGGMGILSFARPPESNLKFSWDVNAGYFNHNDAGLTLTQQESDTLRVESATQELVFGAAARLTRKKVTLFAELHGRFFLRQPPETAYTRENFIYFSPGLVYQFNPYIQVVAGADFLVTGLDDQTIYEQNNVTLLQKPWRTVPNLPDWRFNIGLVFRLKEGSPPEARQQKERTVETNEVSADALKKNDREEKKQRERDLQELELRLRSEQKESVSENEEERLERLEAQRQRMYQVLQELREAMEERERQETRQREEEMRRAEERRRQEELQRQKEREAQAAVETTPDSLAAPDAELLQTSLDGEPTEATAEQDTTMNDEPQEQTIDNDSTAVMESEQMSPPDSSTQEVEPIPEPSQETESDASPDAAMEEQIEPDTVQSEPEIFAHPPDEKRAPEDTTGTAEKPQE